MSLKQIYGLTEAPLAAGSQENDPASASTQRIGPGSRPQAQGQLNRVFGQGPVSNGVPELRGGGDGQLQGNVNTDPEGTVPTPGTPTAQDSVPTLGGGYGDTIPNPRQNPGGTGGPPQNAGPFSRAPNAPGGEDDEGPLPDLPLESSIKGLYGLHMTEAQVRSPIRGPARLVELYNLDEMPRPAGSYGRPAMEMLKWAKDQGGREFTAREAFKVWRQAGGQPNQASDNKAYQSFQTTLRQFVDPNGRGTPEKPLVNTVKGVRGSRAQAGIYAWGSVRPSKTVTARQTPGTTPFDDMELGPAGAADQGEQEPEQEPEAQAQDQGEFEPEEPEAQAEPEQDEEEPADEDEFDWIPQADPETPIGRHMIELQEDDPEKLQTLLTDVYQSKTVLLAVTKAQGLYKNPRLRTAAIRVARYAAEALGLDDPDGYLDT